MENKKVYTQQFLYRIFRDLNDNDLRYAILRKSSEIISGNAHDIDMAIDYNSRNIIFNRFDKIAKELGWKKIISCKRDTGNDIIHYAYIDMDNVETVFFDLFYIFGWNDIILLNNEDLLKDRRYDGKVYCVSELIEKNIMLLTRYIYHGYIKNEYRNEIYSFFIENENEVIDILSKMIGMEFAEKVFCLVINQRWTELEKKQNELIISIKSNYKKSILKKFIGLLKLFNLKILRIIKIQTPMVVFLGTDGSGKTTIIENIPMLLTSTFNQSKITYFHWRPGFIKPKKGNKSIVCAEPHAQKPYGKLKSFLKFMFFNLDYILGYWILVRKNLGQNKLVVFDRYYYDYYLDKIRYRLDISDKVLDFWKMFIPKPDITFLLVGDARTLYERKKEIPVEEIQNQIDRLLKNKEKFNNSVVIDVNQSIDKVVYDVSKEILNQCSKKYNKE